MNKSFKGLRHNMQIIFTLKLTKYLQMNIYDNDFVIIDNPLVATCKALQHEPLNTCAGVTALQLTNSQGLARGSQTPKFTVPRNNNNKNIQQIP